MSARRDYSKMPKEELERLYSEAVRNYSSDQRLALERNAAPNSADNPHLANAKSIYRALAAHLTGGAGYWDNGKFEMRA